MVSSGLVLLGVAALMTLGFYLYAFGVSLAPAALLLFVWTLVPYVLYAVVLRRSQASTTRLATVLVAGVATLLAVVLYLDALVIRPAPEASYSFLFVPVLQLLAMVGIPVAARLIPESGDRASGSAS